MVGGVGQKRLLPFFTFFGGKWRVAGKYPVPRHSRIVEPFAGSAGYSLHYYWKEITLADADPIICGVWEYLIGVSTGEVLELPVGIQHVDDIHSCQEARWLVGFWLNKGSAQPAKSPSKWMRSEVRPNSYWGEVIRSRIAEQVAHIRHWRVLNISYERLENQESTWFIDPPYCGASGKYYKYGGLDYDALAGYCRGRCGQVIVCEKAGAEWLPFVPFRKIKTGEGPRGKSVGMEVVWTNDAVRDTVPANWAVS